MNIKKEGENFIITIPQWKKRSNPYMEGEDVGEHPTLIGLIIREKGMDTMGFGYVIDMDYKGKTDQNTGIQYIWSEGGYEKAFREKCIELGIDIFKYPICSKCDESIYGSYSFKEKGNVCYGCELKEKDNS